MNLNRKVVEGSIVAGMLVVMTTATSVTSQVVSDEKATAAVQTVVTADENYTAVAGITRQMALVETGRAEVSVEHSDAQLVAASEEGGAARQHRQGWLRLYRRMRQRVCRWRLLMRIHRI